MTNIVPSKNNGHLDHFSVLVVEDDEDLRGTMMNILACHNIHHIHLAATDEEALQIASEYIINMVISDFNLNGKTGRKGLNGLQVLEEIKKIQSKKSEPEAYQLLYSAKIGKNLIASSSDANEAKAINDWGGHKLGKPYRMAELLVHLNAARDKQQKT